MFKQMFYRMIEGSNLFDEYRAQMLEAQERAKEGMTSENERQAFQMAVDSLTDEEQEYLDLHVREGLHYKKIAERKGVTYQIALKRIATIYAKLRIDLGNYLH